MATTTRLKGTLHKWVDEKGFGFITPQKSKQEIFIHISAFDKNLPRRPQAGDTVFFYTQKSENGKTKAVDAIIEGVIPIYQKIPSKTRTYRREHSSKSSWKFLVLCTVIIIVIGTTIYNRFLSNKGSEFPRVSQLSKAFNATQNPVQSPSRYTCNGKTHCSQMTSCEEATFYQQNCPGTTMDGDGDGVPCESQWCN